MLQANSHAPDRRYYLMRKAQAGGRGLHATDCLASSQASISFQGQRDAGLFLRRHRAHALDYSLHCEARFMRREQR